MEVIEVKCIKCGSNSVIKHGQTVARKQRYMCKNCKKSFILDYTYQACKVGCAESVIQMTANASGNRVISSVLGISTDTVMKILKNRNLQ